MLFLNVIADLVEVTSLLDLGTGQAGLAASGLVLIFGNRIKKTHKKGKVLFIAVVVAVVSILAVGTSKEG